MQNEGVFYTRAALLAIGLMVSFFHTSESDLGNSLGAPSVTGTVVSPFEYNSVESWEIFSVFGNLL